MTKDFAPYNESLALKELGFDESCFGYYNTKGLNLIHIKNSDYLVEADHIRGNWCAAPTFSQAFRWFRENHGLFTTINVDQTTKPKFYYNISEYYEDETTWEWKDGWGNSSLYKTYEEAELACLRNLIEIVKTK